MKISELDQGNEVVFEIITGTETHEFSSHVVDKKSDFILVEPIRIENKILSFSSSSIPVNLILNREGKQPVAWKQVAVDVVLYKKNTVYKVSQTIDGAEVNRRSSYRLYIGVNGVVQVGGHHKAVNVIVKDISESGFSFVCDEEFADSDRAMVHLVFEDDERHISINGLVVRKIILETGRVLYGCLINLKTPLIAQYVNLKQREQIAKMREIKLLSDTRPGVGFKRGGSAKKDKREILLDGERTVDTKRYSENLLDENKNERQLNTERYKNVKL